ncbi:hypothetical protein AVEN_28528-1 [Araneus ventricosus]|uniref:Uncharacterized protein n=1 Tax=Araneus ventricosus TaxID=182803 RepID=A0A4Y2SBW9_ARAVE|nr:hypothetical protein AVEN_28528-1 [Araneus ventricosus]
MKAAKEKPDLLVIKNVDGQDVSKIRHENSLAKYERLCLYILTVSILMIFFRLLHEPENRDIWRVFWPFPCQIWQLDNDLYPSESCLFEIVAASSQHYFLYVIWFSMRRQRKRLLKFVEKCLKSQSFFYQISKVSSNMV